MTHITRAFRRTALPLASYYAVTLALPLANGAAHSGAAFVEHALAVLVVPPIIIVLACAAAAALAGYSCAGYRRLLSGGPTRSDPRPASADAAARACERRRRL